MSLEFLEPVIKLLPEVKKPKVSPTVKKRFMWVIVGLVIFFVLGQIRPYGLLSADYCSAHPDVKGCGRVGFLQNVQTILASNLGTLGTLGIGPIVMASIILQLLSGAELIKIDREHYQGIQKLFAILFCFFEGSIYVYSGFLPVQTLGISLIPLPVLSSFTDLNTLLVIFQIAMGSIILLFLDEVISKWGLGSGIGLFIVGGVSMRIISRSLNPMMSQGRPIGHLPLFLADIIQGSINWDALLPMVFTIVVFLVVVYFEAMRVEIPLTLGRIRGIGGRYPLKFLYASNLPVILAAALFANVQLFASVFAGAGIPVLGAFDAEGQVLPTATVNISNMALTIPSLAYIVRAPYGYLGTPSSIDRYILNASETFYGIPLGVLHILGYTLIMIITCIIFGKFWIETTGMGPKQVAEQLKNTGFSVPGFRRDARVLERVLSRYIPVITVLGSAAVGLLAVGADLTGALGSGTGILLSVGILYRLYEELAQSQLVEMHPALKNFFGG